VSGEVTPSDGEGKVRFLPLLTLLLVIGQPAPVQKCARGSLVAEVTHVRDGDTIEVGGLPIRLQGLAAPEGDKPGGEEATQAMQAPGPRPGAQVRPRRAADV
jgi:endonuclease YncB( thermonuclease family)